MPAAIRALWKSSYQRAEQGGDGFPSAALKLLLDANWWPLPQLWRSASNSGQLPIPDLFCIPKPVLMRYVFKVLF